MSAVPASSVSLGEWDCGGMGTRSHAGERNEKQTNDNHQYCMGERCAGCGNLNCPAASLEEKEDWATAVEIIKLLNDAITAQRADTSSKFLLDEKVFAKSKKSGVVLVKWMTSFLRAGARKTMFEGRCGLSIKRPKSVYEIAINSSKSVVPETVFDLYIKVKHKKTSCSLFSPTASLSTSLSSSSASSSSSCSSSALSSSSNSITDHISRK